MTAPARNDIARLQSVQRARALLWMGVAAVVVVNSLSSMRSDLLAMSIVALVTALAPMAVPADRRLRAAFQFDAAAIFVSWWIVGPVAGIGVVLPLVTALSGILLERDDARRVALAALVATTLEIPAHFWAKSRDGDLWLFHPPSQVVTESEFILGVVVAMATIALTAAVFIRIGERLRQATDRLTESEAAFRGAFTHAPVGVALIARDGGILRSNPRFEEMLPAAARSGRLQALDGTSADPVCDALRSVLAGDGEAVVTIQYIPMCFAEVRVSAVPGVERSELVAVLHVEDVTQRVQLVQSKDAFLEAVAHEVRTPLTGVLGFSEILALDPTVPEGVREMTQEIRTHSLQLKSIVDDLVVIARSDIERLALLPTRVGLLRLVNAALEPHERADVTVSVPDLVILIGNWG